MMCLENTYRFTSGIFNKTEANFSSSDRSSTSAIVCSFSSVFDMLTSSFVPFGCLASTAVEADKLPFFRIAVEIPAAQTCHD